MKTCTKCKKDKPITDFSPNQRAKDKHSYRCKKCCSRYSCEKWREKHPTPFKSIYNSKFNSPEYIREKNLKAWYGITILEYNEMHDKQLGCCAICGRHQNTLKKPLFVDHCHTTDKIRGLLCQFCNTMLGHAKDNKETLQKAIDYLNN
jgi:hypothetical protein